MEKEVRLYDRSLRCLHSVGQVHLVEVIPARQRLLVRFPSLDV